MVGFYIITSELKKYLTFYIFIYSLHIFEALTSFAGVYILNAHNKLLISVAK